MGADWYLAVAAYARRQLKRDDVPPIEHFDHEAQRKAWAVVDAIPRRVEIASGVVMWSRPGDPSLHLTAVEPMPEPPPGLDVLK
jgi:hypothetical protein